MKKILLVILLTAMFQHGMSQILHPVKWTFGYKKLSVHEAVLFFKATIDNGWHLYSQNMADGGPTKTVFSIRTSPQYTLKGKTMESKPITKFEQMFNMQVGYFEHQAVFQQKIKLNTTGKITAKGTITYGACDDHQCIPPEDEIFNIAVK